MKKRVFAILLSISMIAAIVGCGKVSGTLDDQAATREYDPNDDTIYIVDPFVPLSDSADSAELRALAQAALVKVNDKRAAAGLGDLKWTIGLEQAAQVRANEIEDKFSHDRPDGTAFWTVNGNLVYGENLARGFNTADEVVAAWVASPTHNANLMDPGYATCSIAIHEVGDMKCWAQEFGY